MTTLTRTNARPVSAPAEGSRRAHAPVRTPAELAAPAAATAEPRLATAPVRLVLAAVGVALVAIGAVGVWVPGLPTTIFLILASGCFARSCPWLERKLIRTPLFGPFLRYMDPSEPMPTRARVIALALMWPSVAVSVWVLRGAPGGPWIASAVVLAALVGTAVILTARRGVGSAAAATGA